MDKKIIIIAIVIITVIGAGLGIYFLLFANPLITQMDFDKIVTSGKWKNESGVVIKDTNSSGKVDANGIVINGGWTSKPVHKNDTSISWSLPNGSISTWTKS